MMVCSLKLSDRLVMAFGIRAPLTVGLALAAASLGLFAMAPVDGSFVTDVLPSMILLGIGAGIAFNPVLLAAMGDVEPHEAGLASGVVNTSFMMGGALGLAVLVAVSESRTAIPRGRRILRRSRPCTVASRSPSRSVPSPPPWPPWSVASSSGRSRCRCPGPDAAATSRAASTARSPAPPEPRLGGQCSTTVLVPPTAAERRRHLPGDELVDPADVVMDRAFSLPAPPDAVWPWLVQLGKRRAGWYFPRWLERFIPRSRRGLRHLDPAYLALQVGDVIPDWGGKDETFTVAELEPGHHLLHTSPAAGPTLTWCLRLTPEAAGTRMHLRLRLAPVKHQRLAEYAGGLVDWLTIAGLAAGLRERV